MLTEDDVRQLIALKTETKNLDYKESINWDTSSKDERVKIVKDILAMANTQDGGRIIFGVRNSDFDFVGMPDSDYESFDQTKVNDLLQNYTEPKHSCQVHKHNIDKRYIVAVDTPEFEEVPIICKKECHSSDNPSEQILRRGEIYIRTEKATSEAISSPEQMRELLGRSLVKKSDEFLATIERLIKGKPSSASEDSKAKYAEEVRDAEGFFSEKIGDALKTYGYWAIHAYPTQYDSKRVANQKAIEELMRRSEVSLRGWSFPFTDPEKGQNFAKGRQSYTIWDRFVEGYRAYKSGLFICKKAFWEDVEGHRSQDKGLLLSYKYSIWLVTEIFLFLKRYFGEAVLDGDVKIKIVLNGTKGRRLHAFNRNVFLRGPYVAVDDQIAIIDENVKAVDLRASHEDIAYRVIKDAFLAFNWDISPAAIRELQAQLLEGRA